MRKEHITNEFLIRVVAILPGYYYGRRYGLRCIPNLNVLTRGSPPGVSLLCLGSGRKDISPK